MTMETTLTLILVFSGIAMLGSLITIVSFIGYLMRKKHVATKTLKVEEKAKTEAETKAKIEKLNADKSAMEIDLNNATTTAEKRMITREIEAINTEINSLTAKK